MTYHSFGTFSALLLPGPYILLLLSSLFITLDWWNAYSGSIWGKVSVRCIWVTGLKISFPFWVFLHIYLWIWFCDYVCIFHIYIYIYHRCSIRVREGDYPFFRILRVLLCSLQMSSADVSKTFWFLFYFFVTCLFLLENYSVLVVSGVSVL